MQRQNPQAEHGFPRRMPNLGEHYRHGPSANSSYVWNVELVIEALAHRGLVAAKGRELLLELKASEQKN